MVRAIVGYRPDLDVSGCDLSLRALREAKRRSHTTRVSAADAGSLPYRSESFNGVLLFDVLEHLPDPACSIREAARVLKPSGILCISVPMEGRFWTIQGLLRRMGWGALEKTVGHIQAFDSEQIERMLVQGGFWHVRVRWSGHLISQMAHTGYVIWLSLTGGKRSAMSVESLISDPSRGSWKRLLGTLKSAVAILSYIESKALRSIPGACAHIDAIKPADG